MTPRETFKASSGLHWITLPDSALGTLRRFGLFLPAGYEDSDEKFPVLYLFRGHESEWIGFQDGRPGLAQVLACADTPFVVVLPGFMESSRLTQGVPVNWSARTEKRGVGNGRFHDHFLEIKTWVESHCRVGVGPGWAALDGFSMGGYSAVLLGTKYPEQFGSVGAYDGSFMWEGQLDRRRHAEGKDDALWFSDTCAPYFRRMKAWDRKKMERNNPLALIEKAKGGRLVALRKTTFHLRAAGDERVGNVDRTRHLVEALGGRGVENSFEGRELYLDPSARHSWYWADKHLEGTLPLHVQALERRRRSEAQARKKRRLSTS